MANVRTETTDRRTAAEEHISYEEMADYVFSDGRGGDFIKTAARINRHVMSCPACGEMYRGLMALRDRAEEYAAVDTVQEKLLIRLFRALLITEPEKAGEKILEDCRRFKLWLSFRVKNLRELAGINAEALTYPRLVTVMRSATGPDGVEKTESVIRSSLFDRQKNRVSIGLDGTLSLYFDSAEYSAGSRVLILPNDGDADPQMIELVRYDDSICYVRFEGISPGKYTVMVER